MWAVKVVWDGGGEQPTAFPVAGKSTWHSSAPKTKMFLTVTFWLSYYDFGKKGLYPSHMLGAGCGWGPQPQEKVQITKTVVLFLDELPYWGLRSHRFHFSLTFTALCLCSMMTALIFFLLSFICHWEIRNDQFHFICWESKAVNLLDTGACGEA